MQKGQRNSLSHFLGLIVSLFAIWILFSGKFEVKFLLIGLLSSIIIAYICKPFLYVTNSKTGNNYYIFDLNFFKLLFYSIWLLKEIIFSTIEVSKEIITHKEHEPRIVYFKMPYEHPMANVVLSHSIILTPGTITIDVSEDGIYEVHALNNNLAEGLLSGQMQLKVAKLFNESCTYEPLQQKTYVRKGVK